MEDPFQFVESLGSRTLGYVGQRNSEFRSEFGPVSEELRSMVAKFNETKTVLQPLISGDHMALLYREGNVYSVSVDGDIWYSTEKVILWIAMDSDCIRLAVYETSGSDAGTLKIMRNSNLEEEIHDRINQIVFTDNSFYEVKTYSENPPPDGGELNSHRVLLDGNIVFGRGLAPSEFINLHRSGGMIIAGTGNWEHGSLFLGPADDPERWEKFGDFDVPVVPLGMAGGDLCYLERRGNGIIRKGDLALIEGAQPIEACVMVKEGFLVLHLEDAKIKPVLYDFSGNILKTFGTGRAMGLISIDSDETDAALALESFGTPYTLMQCHDRNMKEIESNQTLDVSVEEKYADSTGTSIHYFLVRNRSRKEKGTLAYGYGGFNVSLCPRYMPLFAALLSSGVSIAQANLRGGGEYGEKWHKAGAGKNKQNVFDDFISVIHSLRKENHGVVAYGRSNGGLLVGGVLTQQPDILDGAVIGLPVLDMMKFHRLSVGSFWVNEYGNPDLPEDKQYLLKYSPYHNIRKVHYPSTLIFTRLNDDRVHPAHAIKFHMRLSDVSPSAYLRINTEGGHSGLSSQELTEEICDIYNFIMKCLNQTA